MSAHRHLACLALRNAAVLAPNKFAIKGPNPFKTMSISTRPIPLSLAITLILILKLFFYFFIRMRGLASSRWRAEGRQRCGEGALGRGAVAPGARVYDKNCAEGAG
jgi:hypothetical protein